MEIDSKDHHTNYEKNYVPQIERVERIFVLNRDDVIDDDDEEDCGDDDDDNGVDDVALQNRFGLFQLEPLGLMLDQKCLPCLLNLRTGCLDNDFGGRNVGFVDDDCFLENENKN